MEDFHLETHVGGYSGQMNSIRDWLSFLRFQEGDGWAKEPLIVKTNDPKTNSGLSFYQASQWRRS